MVKLSDFAGPHRSYPIPTKADARDALRLAGLHGNKSVRAKVLAKYPSLKAEGGWLNTQGGNFSNGVTFIGEGGTHEQNPFQGVQMGVDEQNVPNLVEEGEVVYDDYVFSNRLKVPKSVQKKYKLRGKTFADAAKHLQKESEERPNDPISKRGLQAGMSRLAEAQEEIRARRAGMHILPCLQLVDLQVFMMMKMMSLYSQSIWVILIQKRFKVDTLHLRQQLRKQLQDQLARDLLG